MSLFFVGIPDGLLEFLHLKSRHAFLTRWHRSDNLLRSQQIVSPSPYHIGWSDVIEKWLAFFHRSVSSLVASYLSNYGSRSVFTMCTLYTSWYHPTDLVYLVELGHLTSTHNSVSHLSSCTQMCFIFVFTSCIYTCVFFTSCGRFARVLPELRRHL